MPENEIPLLSKCVERRYAEMLFYEGVLHFGYPSKWIEEGRNGNVGQGDELEGVYSNEITPENFDKRENVDDQTIEGVKYLRSRSIVNWPCYCLYSISDQTKPIGREGDYAEYDMSEAYAQDFSGEETWENRFKTDLPDRKAMVVIHRPRVFLDKVKRRFADFKLEEGRDYYMGCVQYRKEGEWFIYKEVTSELFHKAARFEKQQEFRIALNSDSLKVKEMLKGGQDVDLGSSLEDCAMLKSHFYKGARILVKDGEVKRLEIRDSRNLWGPLHEMEFVPLINLWGTTKLGATFKLGDGREVNGSVLGYEVWNLLISKYQATISGGRIMAPRGGYKTIVENEEKDSYFYLRQYGGGETSWFEGVIVHTPEGVKEYTHLTYDVEGLVGPLVHRRNSR
ncbi:MAG: hypothetical protein J6X89_03815 [Bacteroidales bacterium]|nr:hypothetical protein [Bacteroidales bacterium]